MRIKKVHIINYRSIFDSGELEITKLFALIGKNNCGKSAFIDALQVFWGEKDVAEEDYHKGNGEAVEIKITILDFATAPHAGKEIAISFSQAKGESGKYLMDGKASPQAAIRKILPELLIIPAIRRPSNETTAGADSFLKKLLSKIINLKKLNSVDLGTVESKPAKDLTIDELNALLESKTKASIESVSKQTSLYFQEAINDKDLSIEIDAEGDLSKAMGFVTRIKDPHLGKDLDKVDVLNCGTGLQSMVILALLQAYADINKNEESIMLIEEPEVYLHPELQRKMFSVLRRIAQRTQVIYTTHSPIMISELWVNDSVRLVTRNAGQTDIKPIDISGVISELGIRYDDVLNPSAIVFVEGESDVAFYQQLTRILHPEYSANMDRRIKFIPTEGYKKIHTFALMNILLSSNVEAEYFIIVDGDGYEPGIRANDIYDQIVMKLGHTTKISTLKQRIKALREYSIESLCLDYEFVKKVCSVGDSDFQYFLNTYKRKFDFAKNKYNESKSKQDLEDLQKNFKPKYLFENPKYPSEIARLEKAYDGDAAFLKTRSVLIEACLKIRESGGYPLASMIDVKTAKQPIVKEAVSFLEEILKSTNSSLALFMNIKQHLDQPNL